MAEGELISCLHVVEFVINDGNGWESVDDDKSSVLMRKPVVVDVESEDSKKIKSKRIIFFQ